MELNYVKDLRMLETCSGALQISYRVQLGRLDGCRTTVGWIRKVNHGKRPWLFFAAKDLAGKWNRMTESFETLADLKHWAARLCPTCMVRPRCGKDANLCWKCFEGGKS